MEELDSFIRSKMKLVEDEVKTKYSDLLNHHREEQMKLSPEDYTNEYGKVDTPMSIKHDGPPPIPEGSWPIVFQYYKWSIRLSNVRDCWQEDYICVDNRGNEYTMRNRQKPMYGSHAVKTGWICSTDRRVPLTNSLIDLFKTDSWFTAKIVEDGRNKYEGRSVNEGYVRIGTGGGQDVASTPLNINSLFLSALCKIAEDYNKRFIKYADLYHDGKLREYSGVVDERNMNKKKVEDLEKTLQEYREREEQSRKDITELKKSISENESVIEGLREINQDLEAISDRFRNEALTITSDYETTKREHVQYVKKMEKSLKFYRKDNERLSSEMDTMASGDEVRDLQKEIRTLRKDLTEALRFKDLYEKSLKSDPDPDGDIQNVITRINDETFSV
jgi:hypothetical protein